MTENSIPLSSNRPYLLRAIYDWLLDNHLTPQLLVDALQSGVQVPQQHVKDGQILLNIGVSAINNLVIDNHNISFSARFSGNPMQVIIPVFAVSAIFSKENGQGMAFTDEAESEQVVIDEVAEEIVEEVILESVVSNPESKDESDETAVKQTQPKSSPEKGQPTLKIVK